MLETCALLLWCGDSYRAQPGVCIFVVQPNTRRSAPSLHPGPPYTLYHTLSLPPAFCDRWPTSVTQLYSRAITVRMNCSAAPSLGASGLIPFPFDRVYRQVLALPGRSLHVCPPGYTSRLLSIITLNAVLTTASWEFVTTLDYEWSVIRGHRPYRWTIWVCDFWRFSWVSLFCPD
jgi:hypothetical protein